MGGTSGATGRRLRKPLVSKCFVYIVKLIKFPRTVSATTKAKLAASRKHLALAAARIRSMQQSLIITSSDSNDGMAVPEVKSKPQPAICKLRAAQEKHAVLPTKTADKYSISDEPASSSESDTEDYSEAEIPTSMRGPGAPTSFARMARCKLHIFLLSFTYIYLVACMPLEMLWLKYRDLDGEVYSGSIKRPAPGKTEVPSLGRKVDKFVDTFGFSTDFIKLLHKAATLDSRSPSHGEFIVCTARHLSVFEAIYFYKRIEWPLKPAVRIRRYAMTA